MARPFGKPRRVKREGFSNKARNTDMLLFKGQGGWYYICVISKFSSAWLHLIYQRKDPETGSIRRFYIPCCKSVVVEEVDGEDEYKKGEEDCPGCERAIQESGRGREAFVYFSKLHHSAYLAVLGRTRDPKKEPEPVQELFLWSFNDDILKDIEMLGDITPLKTRILIEAEKANYGTKYSPHPYNGPAIKISPELNAAYKEANKAKQLEAFIKPPPYDELAKVIEDQEKKVKGTAQIRADSGPSSEEESGLGDDDNGDLDDADIDAVLEEDEE